MLENKRRGEPAIPQAYHDLLTREQTFSLNRLTTFGWSLSIVRRPRFEPIEIIVEHSSGKYAVLDSAGELDHSEALRMRRMLAEQEYVPDEEDPWSNSTGDTDSFLPEITELPETSDPIVVTINKEPLPRACIDPRKPPKKFFV